jgi:hypothetical protein
MGKNNYNQCILVYVFVWMISFVLPSFSAFAMKGDHQLLDGLGATVRNFLNQEKIQAKLKLTT